MGLKDKLAGINDLPVLKVETPEWEPDVPCVWVRTVLGPETVAFQDSIEGAGNAETLSRFVAFVLCSEDGRREFGDEEADCEILGKKNPAVLTRISDAAQEHNGMSKAAREAMAKNSEAGQT